MTLARDGVANQQRNADEQEERGQHGEHAADAEQRSGGLLRAFHITGNLEPPATDGAAERAGDLARHAVHAVIYAFAPLAGRQFVVFDDVRHHAVRTDPLTGEADARDERDDIDDEALLMRQEEAHNQCRAGNDEPKRVGFRLAEQARYLGAWDKEDCQRAEHEHHDERLLILHVELVDQVVREHGGHQRKRRAHDHGDGQVLGKRTVFERAHDRLEWRHLCGFVVDGGFVAHKQPGNQHRNSREHAKDQAYHGPGFARRAAVCLLQNACKRRCDACAEDVAHDVEDHAVGGNRSALVVICRQLCGHCVIGGNDQRVERVEQNERTDDGKERHEVGHSFRKREQQPERQRQRDGTEDQVRPPPAPAGTGFILKITKQHIVDHIPGQLAYEDGRARDAGVDMHHVRIVKEHVKLQQRRDGGHAEVAHAEFELCPNRELA
ncbi:hypothetical protein SDC9_63148 [bioreactor metagenome]|uniref:Uncharacterized protein n=1 Tax=bioreactor metagenome TaxID=1076179 RepID=A0A644XKP7_9ZZZZ